MEVAGLVLGAVPILVQIVAVYKEGVRTIRRAIHLPKTVEKLARALNLQQLIFEETMRVVLTASGCDLQGLEVDPIGYFQNKDVQRQVKNLLGDKKSIILIDILNDTNVALEKIAGIIASLAPASAGSTDVLLYIIQADKKAVPDSSDLLPRIKMLFKYSSLNTLIDELDRASDALSRFAQLFSSRQVANPSSTKARKLAKALRRVRMFASNLHLALRQGWSANCHSEHEAKLFLEDRMDTAIDILRARQKAMLPLFTFNLIFAAELSHNQMLWHESVVQIYGNDDSDEYSNSSELLPRLSRVDFVTPERETAIRPDISFVGKVCAAIEAIENGQRPAAFVLIPTHQIGIITLDQKMWSKHEHCSATSLGDLYRACSQSPITVRICSLELRMTLALKIASSLLQLAQTSWLQHPWSKDSIYFPLTHGPSNSCSQQPQVEKPFISVGFDTATSDSQQQQASPRELLLELGILLLELWHESTFEVRHPLATGQTNYYTRLALAAEWADDTGDRLLEHYADAVNFCLHPLIKEQTHIIDWNDRVTEAVCENVVVPLQKICNQWSNIRAIPS